jgi:hypothetical protein
LNGIKRTVIIGTLIFDRIGCLCIAAVVGEGQAARSVRVDLELADDVAADFYSRQYTAPDPVPGQPNLWAFHDVVVAPDFATAKREGQERSILLIKRCVLREERLWKKIEREVEAFDNMDRLPAARRERIPDNVRLLVWQRDEGRCVQCGSQASLEYDHIIPVVRGGSNTERNIRLLCEACNRRKGADIA